MNGKGVGTEGMNVPLRPQPMFVLPPDPYWLLRVLVPNDRDCVPYHVFLLWHWQFFTPRDFVA